ncbi:MAG: Nif3-like dinuclear metal center hexameric protein [Candidatus Delongbacteria bacterium]|nr:Nif3-like dinuclear metal center hexameric protein [Candidatus Delongbacteria bacterium]
MKVSEVLKILNSKIVTSVKWKNDPSGLLVGDMDSKVTGILTALNPTLQVAEEAKEKGCNLIVSHHPLFKKPVTDLVEGDYYSDIIRFLVKNDISLISFHTNYDLAKEGVSFLLARELGLKNIRPLTPITEIKDVEINELYKLVAFCPEGSEEGIMKAIDSEGGATIGRYDHCYFSTPGTGNFRPGPGTVPFVGKESKIESVKEIRIETVVQEWNKDKVASAVKSAHPYEEPVIDLYPLCNVSGNFGLGAIADTEKGMTLKELAQTVSDKLKTGTLRIAVKDAEMKISSVAVCGGSGSSSWKAAMKNGAGAIITSEFNHHVYQEASYFINIIDATHHATEQFAKKGLKENLEPNVSGLRVYESETDTDVVKALTEI